MPGFPVSKDLGRSRKGDLWISFLRQEARDLFYFARTSRGALTAFNLTISCLACIFTETLAGLSITCQCGEKWLPLLKKRRLLTVASVALGFTL